MVDFLQALASLGTGFMQGRQMREEREQVRKDRATQEEDRRRRREIEDLQDQMNRFNFAQTKNRAAQVAEDEKLWYETAEGLQQEELYGQYMPDEMKRYYFNRSMATSLRTLRSQLPRIEGLPKFQTAMTPPVPTPPMPEWLRGLTGGGNIPARPLPADGMPEDVDIFGERTPPMPAQASAAPQMTREQAYRSILLDPNVTDKNRAMRDADAYFSTLPAVPIPEELERVPVIDPMTGNITDWQKNPDGSYRMVPKGTGRAITPVMPEEKPTTIPYDIGGVKVPLLVNQYIALIEAERRGLEVGTPIGLTFGPGGVPIYEFDDSRRIPFKMALQIMNSLLVQSGQMKNFAGAAATNTNTAINAAEAGVPVQSAGAAVPAAIPPRPADPVSGLASGLIGGMFPMAQPAIPFLQRLIPGMTGGAPIPNAPTINRAIPPAPQYQSTPNTKSPYDYVMQFVGPGVLDGGITPVELDKIRTKVAQHRPEALYRLPGGTEAKDEYSKAVDEALRNLIKDFPVPKPVDPLDRRRKELDIEDTTSRIRSRESGGAGGSSDDKVTVQTAVGPVQMTPAQAWDRGLLGKGSGKQETPASRRARLNDEWGSIESWIVKAPNGKMYFRDDTPSTTLSRATEIAKYTGRHLPLSGIEAAVAAQSGEASIGSIAFTIAHKLGATQSKIADALQKGLGMPMEQANLYANAAMVVKNTGDYSTDFNVIPVAGKEVEAEAQREMNNKAKKRNK